VKVISDRLGHATTSFTQDVYMHAIPAVEEDAADQIANIVFNGTTEPSEPQGAPASDDSTGDGDQALPHDVDPEDDAPSPGGSYDQSDGC